MIDGDSGTENDETEPDQSAPRRKRQRCQSTVRTEGEPFFVPLAVPLLAGPSTLAMLILLARSQPERIFEWLAAVLGAWAVTCLIMLSSNKLNKLFGKRGLIAVERLMGMVLVAISVQMLMDGITTYLNVLIIR